MTQTWWMSDTDKHTHTHTHTHTQYLSTNRDLHHSRAMSAIPAPACHFAVLVDEKESTRTAVAACFEAPGVFVALPLAAM